MNHNRIILTGLPVSPGVISGRVSVIETVAHLHNFCPGDILVIPESHPRYAVALVKASGLICEVGGMLSHVCIVAVEMGIPCITQVEGAVQLLKSVSGVILDANAGVVSEQ